MLAAHKQGGKRMENVVTWVLSLPAVMGIVVFALGCYFAFRRHKKGVLKVKLPLVGELSTETLGVAFVVMAVPFLLVAHHVYVKNRELAAAEQSARQASSLVTYARLMSPEERAPLFVSIAKVMRHETRQIGSSSGAESLAALDRMEAAAKLLLSVEPENGHGVYFLGEAFRLRQSSDSQVRFRGAFRQYVSSACSRSSESFKNRSDANACYGSGSGYCAERIAWALHLLANDYYRDAMRESDVAAKASKLRTALEDAEGALQVWGKSFAQSSSSNLATDVVRDRARAGLQAHVAIRSPCSQEQRLEDR